MKNETDTELNKLSHLLNCDTTDIQFLGSLSLNHIQQLSNKIQNALFTEHSPIWKKLGAVSKIFPNFVNAKVAQDILGPQITANLSYHVPIKESISVAKHFKVVFLIEVMEHLIPERAKDLINSFSLEFKKKVVRQMLKQKCHYLMGNFVEVLDFDTIIQLSSELQNAYDLIVTATYTQKKELIASVLQTFTDQKILILLEKAVELNLQSEIISILTHTKESEITRYANIFAQATQITKNSLLACSSSNKQVIRIIINS